jgi:hypothetical protein
VPSVVGGGSRFGSMNRSRRQRLTLPAVLAAPSRIAALILS